MIYGYARISTDGQSLDAQHAALNQAGAEKVFAEIVSGAQTKRTQLDRLLRSVSDGDIVIVTRLDRLARSTRDLLNILALISECGAAFPVFGRCVGGYDDAPRPANVDGARRARGV